MSMSDGQWKGVKKDTWRGTRLVIAVVAVIVLLCGAASVAYWGFGVGTSDVKGQGDATKNKNSGANRVFKQEEFNKRFQDILAADKNIDVAKAALDRDPKNTVLQTNYTGTITYCNSAVGEYNSLAREYNAREFRDADLPEQIDDTDPKTDCKETQK